MSEWAAWDAIGDALTKTRYLLFEPFDLGMWVKLAIILFFIGTGGLNFGYNSPSGNFGDSEGFKCFDDDKFGEVVEERVSEMPAFVHRNLYLIALASLLILLAIVLFSYISCAMEFAFVESVVNNTVTIGTYIRNNLGNALQLFVLRWILGITFLIAIILSLLPALSSLFKEDFSIVFFGSLFMFFTVVVIGSVILALVGSFINLAIPVMLYEDVNIISALAKVVGTAARSIPQLLWSASSQLSSRSSSGCLQYLSWQ
jgi:type IV secretory pathway VirB3-like protein